jgi:hypothetical protein
MGAGAIMDRLSHRPDQNMALKLLLAGLIGGGLMGAYSGHHRSKPIMLGQGVSPRNHFGLPTTGPGSELLRYKAAGVKKASVGIFGHPGDFSSPELKFVREISGALQSDSQMDFSQKAALMTAIEKLNSQQLAQLYSVVRGAGGFGIGLLIARFLFKRGLIGSFIGGMLGLGAASSMFGEKPPRDAYGFSTMGNRDIFGRSIL